MILREFIEIVGNVKEGYPLGWLTRFWRNELLSSGEDQRWQAPQRPKSSSMWPEIWKSVSRETVG
jgi:hypothetical protein